MDEDPLQTSEQQIMHSQSQALTSHSWSEPTAEAAFQVILLHLLHWTILDGLQWVGFFKNILFTNKTQ